MDVPALTSITMAGETSGKSVNGEIILSDGVLYLDGGSNLYLVSKSKTEITIPSTVSTINQYALKCPNITKITIEGAITGWPSDGSIADRFNGCYNLQSVIIEDQSSGLKSDEQGAIIMTDSEGKTTLIYVPQGKESYTVTADRVATSAIRHSDKLTTLEFANPDTDLSEMKLNGCTALKTVTFPEGTDVSKLEVDLFTGCESLESVMVGEREYQITETGSVQDYVAAIGDEWFVTVKGAVEAASAGQTVTLRGGAHVVETEPLEIDKGITLDLDGHELVIVSEDGENRGIVFTSGESKIIDGTITDARSKGNTDCNFRAVLADNAGTSLHLENVKIQTYRPDGNNYNYILRIDKGASVTLGNGTQLLEIDQPLITGTIAGAVGVAVWGSSDETNPTALVVEDGSTITTNGFCIAGNGTSHNTSITINGGTITSNNGAAAIYHPQYGKLTVNSGKIEAMKGAGIVMCAGDLVVKNANVIAHATSDVYPGDSNHPMVPSAIVANESIGYAGAESGFSVSIEGGSFTSADGVDSVTVYEKTEESKVTTEISGGTFTTNVSEYAAPGFAVVPNADGTYGPVESESSEETISEDGQTVQVSVVGDVVTIPVADRKFTDITLDLSFGSTEMTIVGDVDSDVTVRYYTIGSADAELAFEMYIDGVVDEGMGVVVAVPVTLGENERIDTDTLYAYSVTDQVQTPETVYVSGDYIVVVTDHNTPFYVNYDVVSSVPFPPVWDDDDDYVPPVVPSQTDDSGDDSTTEIVACAAAAVVAALMAAFLIMTYRKD